jgi:hypothetical protein
MNLVIAFVCAHFAFVGVRLPLFLLCVWWKIKIFQMPKSVLFSGCPPISLLAAQKKKEKKGIWKILIFHYNKICYEKTREIFQTRLMLKSYNHSSKSRSKVIIHNIN